ncbi:MAG: tetratricopeptide repeat protein [Elusimicrobia bacterium]|nr:tetratricopeptide repeat protein [Elusimicrobiota bacterium]
MRAYRPRVSVMAAMARGRACVDEGHMGKAIAAFDEAARLDPLCAQAYIYRAGLKLLAGDETGALGDFRAMSGMDHSYLPAYRDLTTLSAEEFPRLIPAAQGLLRRAPDCAWARVFHAFSLRSLMRYEEAVSDLDAAVALEPGSAALWAMRSRVKLTNAGRFYDGVSDMERAVALEPAWGWLRCWLGEALRHQGRFSEALKSLSLGLKLEPRYLRGWAWRGGVRVALGQHREAVEDLSRSLAWDPIYNYDFEYTADQKSWACNQIMAAYKGLGEFSQALRALNRAHALGPRYSWVFNPKNDPALFEEGIGQLSRTLKTHPRMAWALAWRGWTHWQWGKSAEALADIERALRLSPRLAWPRAWRGKILLSRGEPGLAREALDRAVALSPGYAQAWGWRAEALAALDLPRQALRDFTKAVELDHRAAWAFAGRGECRRRLGDLSGAVEDLDRAVGIYPEYAQAQAWREEARRLLAAA